MTEAPLRRHPLPPTCFPGHRLSREIHRRESTGFLCRDTPPRHGIELRARHAAEDVPVPEHDAPLPLGLRVALGGRLDQADTGIADNELDKRWRVVDKTGMLSGIVAVVHRQPIPRSQ